ncbi:helix-turn-helix domain-containing protein [Mycobacterium sp. AMU20-3851]|uniref:TetR/AcrR family transcriptional regulator n=1 Tax=Mycobacterium sp. AMU20-3851 TaxID=3122055 RepID=UPI003754D65D
MAGTRSSTQLVEAALHLIAESGLDSLTLSQVAERAQVSRATAYREFGDKDGLLSAVAQREIAAMSSAVLAAVDLRGEPCNVVPSVVTAALRYLRDHAAFTYVRDHEPHWLLRAGLTVGNDRLNLVQTVAGLVAPAIHPHPALALAPLPAAEVVVRTVLSHTLIEDSSLDDQQVAEAVTRAITKA